MRQFIILMNLMLLSKLVVSQEVKIEVSSDSIYPNHSLKSVHFKICNYSQTELWFLINGFGSKIFIKDELGNIIEPLMRVEPGNTGLPDYILLKSIECEEIVYPIYDLSKRFNLRKEKDYYLYFEYENTSQKKKSHIKTYIGKLTINPLKF